MKKFTTHLCMHRNFKFKKFEFFYTGTTDTKIIFFANTAYLHIIIYFLGVFKIYIFVNEACDCIYIFIMHHTYMYIMHNTTTQTRANFMNNFSFTILKLRNQLYNEFNSH